MGFNFVVDHPLRAEALRKAMGAQNRIVCTNGPLYGLPRYCMGIDVINDFKPMLALDDEKAAIVQEIQQFRNEPVFILTDPSDDGYWLAQQCYALLKLKPSTKAHVALDALGEFNLNLNQLSSFAQSLNIPACQAADARRCMTRLVAYMMIEHIQRRNPELPKALPSNMDYYGAAAMIHLLGMHQSRKFLFGLRLDFDNGFVADMVNPDSPLEHPKYAYTNNRDEFNQLANKIAERDVALQITNRETQILTIKPPKLPTMGTLAAEWLGEENSSLFDMLNQFELLYSAGIVNFPWSEGHLSRKMFRSRLERFVGSKKLLAPKLTIPKNAVFILDWERRKVPQSALPLYERIRQHTLRGGLNAVTYPVTYLKFQFENLCFVGRQVFPVKDRQTHPELYQPPKFTEEYVGGKFKIDLRDTGGNGLKDFFENYDYSESFPKFLRTFHHLVSSFGYCEISGDKIGLTNLGSLCAGVLQNFQADLDPYAFSTNERVLAAVRQGKRDRTHVLHQWYQGFRGAFDTVHAA